MQTRTAEPNRHVHRILTWFKGRALRPRGPLAFGAVATLGVLCMAPTFWPAPDAYDVWYSCYPDEVLSLSDRAHVRCSQPDGQISYFALPTSDADTANRFTTVISSAMAGGQRVRIFYNTADYTGTTFGCQAHDCRAARAFGIVP